MQSKPEIATRSLIMVVSCWILLTFGCSHNSTPYRIPIADAIEKPECRKSSRIPATGTLVVGCPHEVVALDLETLEAKTLYHSGKMRLKSATPLDASCNDLLLVICEFGDTPSYSESLLRYDSRSQQCVKLFQCLKIGLPVVSPDKSMFAWVSKGDDKVNRLALSSSEDFSVTRFFDVDLLVENTGPCWIDSTKGRSRLLVTQSQGIIATFDEQSGRFASKVSGYCPCILDNSEHFLYRSGAEMGELLEYKNGKIHKICALGGFMNEWYSTLRVSPDRMFAAAIGTLSDQIAGIFSKDNSALLLIDLATGQSERISATVDGQRVSFRDGPWAWISKH